jgi:hypothetical protein
MSLPVFQLLCLVTALFTSYTERSLLPSSAFEARRFILRSIGGFEELCLAFLSLLLYIGKWVPE